MTRNEPDRSDIGYRPSPRRRRRSCVRCTWVGQPRFATRTFSDLDEHSWDFGGNYRLAPGLVLDCRCRSRSAAIIGTHAPRRRHPGLRHHQPGASTMPRRSVQPEAHLHRRPTSTAATSCSMPTRTAAGTPPTRRSRRGYAQVEVPLTGRLELIGGARVEDWNVEVKTVTTQGAVGPCQSEQDRRPAGAGADLPAQGQSEPAALGDPDPLPARVSRAVAGRRTSSRSGSATTIGNPDLQRALIQNYDLRWEWFPGAGRGVELGRLRQAIHRTRSRRSSSSPPAPTR